MRADRRAGAGERRRAGECLIFGSDRRAAPLDAALINGTAAHALDFDDVSNSLGGHPSAPILPALFALGETLDCTGRDFIAAYVAGFETETRIARGVHFHHYEKGWHPTATLGVFGATAACSHLMGLDRARTAQALAIAASLASGIKANFGTMTKPLHVGHTARNGLFAAQLAQGGFTANPEALEHKQGFLMVFNGAGNFDAEAILKDWGQPYDIVRPGLAVKQHPCCGSTHPAIDAMLLLRGEYEVAPEKIARIDSWTHPRRLAHTDRPDPQSGLDAKFSVQYCLARALLGGRIVLEDFEGEAFRDDTARALMRRIHAAPHPEMNAASAEYLGAEVRITFDDGRTIARRVGSALGRGPDNPLPAPRADRQIRQLRRPRAAAGPGCAGAADVAWNSIGAAACEPWSLPSQSKRGHHHSTMRRVTAFRGWGSVGLVRRKPVHSSTASPPH